MNQNIYFLCMTDKYGLGWGGTTISIYNNNNYRIKGPFTLKNSCNKIYPIYIENGNYTIVVSHGYNPKISKEWFLINKNKDVLVRSYGYYQNIGPFNFNNGQIKNNLNDNL